eukprot:1996236-Rhodomonas_salina.3
MASTTTSGWSWVHPTVTQAGSQTQSGSLAPSLLMYYSSWIHAPAWAHLPAAPACFASTLASFPSLPDLPVALEGAKVLGVPLGTDRFCEEFLLAKADDIIAELEPTESDDIIAELEPTESDTWTTAATSSSSSASASKPSSLDSAAILAIGDSAGWEATLQRDDVDAFDAASLVVQLASKRGGWGLPPGAGVADPAFYAAYAGFLRWVQSSVPSLLAFHTAQVTPSTDLRSSSHPLVQHLVRVHDFLTAHCAVVVPPALPGRVPAGTLVPPALGTIAAATEEPTVPRQRQVTAAYMQHWQPHIDVLQRPACTARLADLLDAQKATEYDVTDNISPLIAPGSVVELTQGTLVHAPTAWIASFDACPNRRFPKPEFQVQ